MSGSGISTQRPIVALLILGVAFLGGGQHALAMQPMAQAQQAQTSPVAEVYLADAYLYIKKVQKNISSRDAATVAKQMCDGAKILAKLHGGEPEQWLPLIMGIGKHESTYHPNARSNRNARGVMQVHWPTWRRIFERLGYDQDDLHNPKVGVPAGVAIFSLYLKEAKGSVPRALGKYYGAFDRAYVRGVLTKALEFVRYRQEVAGIKDKERLALALMQLN